MRPYHIEITWIDYDPTNTDDVYRVDVYSMRKENIIQTWTTLGHALGSTISIYIGSSKHDV